MATSPKVHQIAERETEYFTRDEIPDEIGDFLWQNYKKKLSIQPPSLIIGERWEITSLGWVGYIPLSAETGIHLKPKVEIDNLFGMLEYAYDLKSFDFLEGFYESNSLAEFYERLAHVLAQRVLKRVRRGIYRAYIPRNDELPFLRGQIDLNQLSRAPWKTVPGCHYHEHTPDVEENRILAWALFLTIRSGLCTERTLPTIRKSYRALLGSVGLHPHFPADCVGRLYHRLNDDYQPMHALCRFFLEHKGPQHVGGEQQMIPFLVNMDRLYERFVAKWLEKHPLPDLIAKPQEKVEISTDGEIYVNIDLVLIDRSTGETKYVLDTKYKTQKKPSLDDIAQVHFYANIRKCQQAVLVYPVHLKRPFDEVYGHKIRVRSVTFSLDGDLEAAGIHFLKDLFGTENCYNSSQSSGN